MSQDRSFVVQREASGGARKLLVRADGWMLDSSKQLHSDSWLVASALARILGHENVIVEPTITFKITESGRVANVTGKELYLHQVKLDAAARVNCHGYEALLLIEVKRIKKRRWSEVLASTLHTTSRGRALSSSKYSTLSKH